MKINLPSHHHYHSRTSSEENFRSTKIAFIIGIPRQSSSRIEHSTNQRLNLIAMNIKVKGLVLIACFTLLVPCFVDGVTVSCMMAYEEGGARAVLNSPECPQRIISAKISQNSTRNCNCATIQGRRDHQEDRVVCNLNIKLQILGKDGPEESTIGIAAIFDGHGGAEASELASRKLFDYFYLNAVFAAHEKLSKIRENVDSLATKSVHRATLEIDHDFLQSVLEAALRRTIQDIDLEFTEQALEKGYNSGSTATIVVLSNGKYLTANVGDSKAVLCFQRIHVHEDDGVGEKEVYAKELTKDHHPDREDERSRIEAAGGFVSFRGVPRVNGILAISRSIGDIYLKRYGVIAEPEIGPWRRFDPEREYLVIASDGIFESLTPQDVCNLLVSDEPSSSLIVHEAHRKGSTDNLSAIVISGLQKSS